MPRMAPVGPVPRVIVAGTDYPALLTVAQFAAFTGRSLSYVYDGIKKKQTPVPMIDTDGRVGFATVATCELLGLPYEIATRELATA